MQHLLDKTWRASNNISIRSDNRPPENVRDNIEFMICMQNRIERSLKVSSTRAELSSVGKEFDVHATSKCKIAVWTRNQASVALIDTLCRSGLFEESDK